MSSSRQNLLARVNWYLQSPLKHITELNTGNKSYYRGGPYKQLSLYIYIYTYMNSYIHTAIYTRHWLSKIIYSSMMARQCCIMGLTILHPRLSSGEPAWSSTIHPINYAQSFGCAWFVAVTFSVVIGFIRLTYLILWRIASLCHSEHDGVSNHRRLDGLLNRLFMRRS